MNILSYTIFVIILISSMNGQQCDVPGSVDECHALGCCYDGVNLCGECDVLCPTIELSETDDFDSCIILGCCPGGNPESDCQAPFQIDSTGPVCCRGDPNVGICDAESINSGICCDCVINGEAGCGVLYFLYIVSIYLLIYYIYIYVLLLILKGLLPPFLESPCDNECDIFPPSISIPDIPDIPDIPGVPSVSPTTAQPISVSPSISPSVSPTTTQPSSVSPSISPSVSPTTTQPSSVSPSISPSISPTTPQPTSVSPTVSPTKSPTSSPFNSTTVSPTKSPTKSILKPTFKPKKLRPESRIIYKAIYPPKLPSPCEKECSPLTKGKPCIHDNPNDNTCFDLLFGVCPPHTTRCFDVKITAETHIVIDEPKVVAEPEQIDICSKGCNELTKGKPCVHDNPFDNTCFDFMRYGGCPPSTTKCFDIKDPCSICDIYKPCLNDDGYGGYSCHDTDIYGLCDSNAILCEYKDKDICDVNSCALYKPCLSYTQNNICYNYMEYGGCPIGSKDCSGNTDACLYCDYYKPCLEETFGGYFNCYGKDRYGNCFEGTKLCEYSEPRKYGEHVCSKICNDHSKGKPCMSLKYGDNTCFDYLKEHQCPAGTQPCFVEHSKKPCQYCDISHPCVYEFKGQYYCKGLTKDNTCDKGTSLCKYDNKYDTSIHYFPKKDVPKPTKLPTVSPTDGVTNSPSVSPTVTTSLPTSSPTVSPSLGLTVFDFICSRNDLSAYKAFIDSSGTQSIFEEMQNITVFAPTNLGIATIPVEIFDQILASMELQISFVLFHVTRPPLLSTQLVDGQILTMLNGETTLISVEGPPPSDIQIAVPGGIANLIERDIVTINGIVHIIDLGLVPDLP